MTLKVREVADLKPISYTHLILQKELRLWRELTRRRRIRLLKHGQLLQVLLQRLVLLLQRRGERLHVLGAQCRDRAVHQQLLADQLSQRGLRAVLLAGRVLLLLHLLLMTTRELATDPGTRRGRASAGTATAVPLRDIRDLK